MLSRSAEDYLRALYLLDERGKELSITNISEYLGISKPSVSGMMRQLDAAKLVSFGKYSKIKWTRKGMALAKKLTAKHRIVERFLRDKLGMKMSELHEEANRLEHAVSDAVLDRLTKFLGNPCTDPHGKEIPDNRKHIKGE